VYRLIILGIFILCSVQVKGAIVEIDYNFDLNNGTVYDCIPGAHTSTGNYSKCWTNNFNNTKIPNTIITNLDTVVIDISFLPGQKLRWHDDGNMFFSQFSENLQIGLTSSTEDFSTSGTNYSFTFKDVSGGLIDTDVSWILNPLSHSGGGAFLHSSTSGVSNFTDSYFDFSGITVEIDLFNLSTHQTNADNVSVDNVVIYLGSGNFDVIENTAVVTEPSTYFLLMIALFGFLVRKNEGK